MRKISPKLMKKAMKKMGIKIEELEGVEEVLIRFKDKELVIENPQVTLIMQGGQSTYQIIGEATERKLETTEEIEVEEEIEIPEEDVVLVCQQTGVSPDEAKQALKETKGDLAQAILNLKSKKVEIR
ncbi:MAG: nascent polypeptide-associated complex protein [Candidatus Odinarchaeia archaeon]